jgi:outer membrane biosynthesis protein TonB
LSAQQAVLQVVILRDGLLVGTEVLLPGSYAVGSGAQVDLRLDDASVEALHAVLYFQNGRAAIQDNDSTAGIYVNGHRVRACEVRSVDEIVLGPFVLKTRVLAKAPAARAAPPPELAAMLGEAPAERTAPAAPKLSPVPPRPAPVAARPEPPAPSPRAAQARRVAQVTTAPGPSARVDGTVPSTRRGGAAALAGPALEPELTQAVSFPEEIFEGPTTAMPVPRAVQADFEDEAALGAVEISDSQLIEIPDLEEEPRAPRAPPVEPARPQPQPKPKPQAQPKPKPQAQAQPKPKPKAKPAARRNVPVAAGKGHPRLYVELYWGAVRKEARSFGEIPQKKPVKAAASDDAAVPLWGFTLPDDFVLAESHAETFRLFVPPRAKVDDPRRVEGEGAHRYVQLSNGMSVRLREGRMTLVASVAPPPEKTFVNPLAGLPWLALSVFLLLFGGFVSLMLFGPRPKDQPDFQPKNLAPVAVRLIAPEPKKKEEAQKKLEALKDKVEKPLPKVAAKAPAKKERAPVQAEPQAVQPRALKALAKLSAAGPATNDVLAAIDKMGSGPGSKNAKNNFKLSGLVGKEPIANAGIGTFGLGGGGKGGAGTKGMEMLHGRGGGGIGALGAGGFGRGGKVGGTVTRASARSIGVQGSIDREAVAKVVNSHLQEVRACYERALLKDPGLAGKVVLEWTINTAGTVTTARTKSSSLGSGAVEGCILQGLKNWKFPKAQGGLVIVSYPFLFNSVGY